MMTSASLTYWPQSRWSTEQTMCRTTTPSSAVTAASVSDHCAAEQRNRSLSTSAPRLVRPSALAASNRSMRSVQSARLD